MNDVVENLTEIHHSTGRCRVLRPGANSFQTALWTIISLIGFALSLWSLDRPWQTEMRLTRIVIEQPEDLAVPIAQ